MKTSKKISSGRFRESFGRYFEDFKEGEIYEHRPGRTITQSDNTWFTLLTMNQHPIHFDEEFGKGTEFGKTLVASPFTIALMVGMSVSDVSHKAIANLGWTDILLPHPLFVGDTLYAESEVIKMRESKSALIVPHLVTCSSLESNKVGKSSGSKPRALITISALISKLESC